MIIKFINGKNDSLAELKNAIEYVRDKDKTTEELTGGFCCDTKYPYEDMYVTKALHNKCSGKQYEHYVLSFDPDDKVEPELVYEITSKIVSHYNKHQSMWAVHTNTDYVHSHVIMNSVACDGKKFRQWKPQLSLFRSFIDEICRNHGIRTTARIFGHNPVDDVNFLEFTSDELSEVYGGIIMDEPRNPFTWLSTADEEYYTDEYDCCEVEPYAARSSEYNSISDKKDLYLGNTYNLTVSSAEQAREFINSCGLPCNLSVQGVKRLMEEFGGGVAYHIGNQFNIDLSRSDRSDAVEADYEDMD
jgi:hypothetical protein